MSEESNEQLELQEQDETADGSQEPETELEKSQAGNMEAEETVPEVKETAEATEATAIEEAEVSETAAKKLSTIDVDSESTDSKTVSADEIATKMEVAKKPKTAVIIAVVAIVAVIAIVAGFFIHSENEKKAAEEAAEKARIAAIEEYNAYIDNLSNARYQMLQGCATAETAGNLLLDVWRSAIFDSDINEWSDEAKPYYSTDFNEALKILFASDVYKGYVSDIEKNEEAVDKTMKELRNPPKDCERAYDELQDFYATYKSFTKLATSPSGSYQTTSQNFSNLDSEALTHFEKLDTLIPDKKEVK